MAPARLSVKTAEAGQKSPTLAVRRRCVRAVTRNATGLSAQRPSACGSLETLDDQRAERPPEEGGDSQRVHPKCHLPCHSVRNVRWGDASTEGIGHLRRRHLTARAVPHVLASIWRSAGEDAFVRHEVTTSYYMPNVC